MVTQYSLKDLTDFKNSFIEELQHAGKGQVTDFAYSIHNIEKRNNEAEAAQVMVVGGSNFVTCRVINGQY